MTMEATEMTAVEPVAATSEVAKPDTLGKLTEALMALIGPRIEELVTAAVESRLENFVKDAVQEAFESEDFSHAVESVVDNIEFSIEVNTRGYRRR
jgi:hypothetical protein